MNFSTHWKNCPITLSRSKRKLQKYKKDLPVLQEVVNGTWSKEMRLGELKTELASVERKIHLSITPEPKEEPTEQTEKAEANLHCRKILYELAPSIHLVVYCSRCNHLLHFIFVHLLSKLLNCREIWHCLFFGI